MLRGLRQVVDLVDDDEHVAAPFAQQLGDVLVQRVYPLASIDHQDEKVGSLHRGQGLPPDRAFHLA